MDTIEDVHEQFANFFHANSIKSYLRHLSQKMEEGSTCLELPDETDPLMSVEPLSVATSKLQKVSLVGNAQTLDRPFILDQNRLYFQRYFKYEVSFIDKIKTLVSSSKEKLQERVRMVQSLSATISQFFPIVSNTTDWQKIAAVTALLNDFTIITGGPGTGKTTTVAKILALLIRMNPQQKIALAAPTGKAAARMAESLRKAAGNFDLEIQFLFAELRPSTIHRLLETQRNSIYFGHNGENPLNVDTIVVDESSMIDIALFSKLLDAVGPNTRIILLGDKDQLSSVEVGSLFGDLCRTVLEMNHFSVDRTAILKRIFPNEELEMPQMNAAFLQDFLVELRESHRFNRQEGIGKFSHAVIQNEENILLQFITENSDPRVEIDTKQRESLWRKFASGYEAYVKEDNIIMALKKLDTLRILCAVREGSVGVYAWNQRVENFLAERKLIQLTGEIFYENRPIIVTQNNYELGLFNGDIGIIRKDKESQLSKAWFLDNNAASGLKSVPPALISGMETVFAMTIHKSQGSEFDKVLIVLPETKAASMLTREILYTGITRAKEKVIVSAASDTIMEICQRQVKRSSGVSVRL